jgi:hypothetical protein
LDKILSFTYRMEILFKTGGKRNIVECRPLLLYVLG